MRLHRALAAATVCALSAAVIAATPAIATAAESGVRINEVESSGGTPGDWIEFFNPTTSPVSLAGYTVKDSDDSNAYVVPDGKIVPAGGYLVLDQLEKGVGDFDFGLGKADSVRLFSPSGDLVDERTRTAHADTTWGVRDGAAPDWQLTTAPTKGEPNTFAPVEEPTEPGSIAINEIDSQPADWVEFYNPGTEALDVSGFEIRDDSDDHRWQFLPGTSIAGRAYLVVKEDTFGLVGGQQKPFRDSIGISSVDRIRLFDAQGILLDDSLPWQGHAAIGGDPAAATLARCPDGEGAFVLARPTPGATNDCVLPEIAINEIESDADVTDWVEIVNLGTTPVDLSGWTLMDNDPIGHAADVSPVPAGTILPAGAYFVFDQDLHFSFGLGKGDTVTVRNAAGNTVAEYAYTAHAAGVWARCADGTGDFADVPVSTKGSTNTCGDTPGGETPGETWPGSPDVTVVDATPTFLEDSSGLDVQVTADGAFLWAVDNGTGRFWKLRIGTEGAASFAPGWEQGKRARFPKDAGNAAAPGPDTEGITVADDGFVYVASERDNGAKGVNQNVVLKLDPNAPGPDVVATQQWDLTSQLPAVGANLGMEAVEWVADSDLRGRLVDDTTGALYDPARYAGHGNGLFFVAVEDTGDVYAFALKADGSASLVATIDPGLAGVMALDYDTVLGVLWAVCDNGCDGAAAQITLNGTSQPGIVRVDRPAGMPNLNNEGFATAPASLATNGVRPVWWFADGEKSGALHVGTLPAAEEPGIPGVPTVPGVPTIPIGPSTGGSGSVAPPASALVDDARHGVSAPATARPGESVTISVGAERSGVGVDVWMYSTPAKIGSGVLDAAGRITVTIPSSAPVGDHRLAVYSTAGELLGWTDIRIVSDRLAATGAAGVEGALLAAIVLLLAGAGAGAFGIRRRVRQA